MTRPDLDTIRARCDAATPGPWGYRNHEKRYLLDDTTDVVGEVNPGKTSAAITVFSVASGALEDADFLAHARTDIPALLAYVEELEEERNDWREAQEATQVKSDFWRSQFRATYTVGQIEWANRIANAEQRFVDEYDQRKATERERDALREELFEWQHAVECVLGKDWMAEGHGPNEARAELARRAKESADEYADLKHREVMLKRAHGALTDAGCVVPIEIDRTIEHAINALAGRALTAEERLERVTHERDQERQAFEQAMAEAQTDANDMCDVLKRVAASVGVEPTALAEDASIAMHRGVLESCNRARAAAEAECIALRRELARLMDDH